MGHKYRQISEKKSHKHDKIEDNCDSYIVDPVCDDGANCCDQKLVKGINDIKDILETECPNSIHVKECNSDNVLAVLKEIKDNTASTANSLLQIIPNLESILDQVTAINANTVNIETKLTELITETKLGNTTLTEIKNTLLNDILPQIQAINENTDNVEYLIGETIVLLNTMIDAMDEVESLLTDIKDILNKECPDAMHVKECNSDVMTSLLTEIRDNTSSTATSLSTITDSLNNILTEVQAVNANTDQIESQLSTLITETQTGNTTLTEIKNVLTNDILPQLIAIDANTNTVEALITETNVKLDTLITNTDQIEPLLTSILEVLSADCPDAMNVKDCNSDVMTSLLTEIRDNTASTANSLTTITDSLNNILTEVQAINANTDTIESQLTSLITETQTGNTTLTEIRDILTNDILPQLVAINANTNTVEALISETNVKLDTLIANTDQIEPLLTEIRDILAADCPDAMNVKDCNSDAILSALEAIQTNTASTATSLTTITDSLNNILTEVQAVNANTDTIESQLTTLITETQAGNTTLTEIRDTLVTDILPQLVAINANTDTVESLITETNVKLDTLIANTDQVEPLLTSILDVLSADCPDAMNVKECNSDAMTALLTEIRDNTASTANSLSTVVDSLNNILTEVQAVNANTDQIEGLITNLITETVAGNTTLTDIRNSLTNDIFPLLQAISANTDAVETLISETNVKLDTLISNTDQIEPLLTDILGVLSADCPNAMNVKDCNSDAALAALQAIQASTATAADNLAAITDSLNSILTEVQAINANTDAIESQLTTLITETQAGNNTLTEIRDTLINDILPQIQAINENTDTVEALVAETNTLLNTLITNTDQVETLLTDIKDILSADCPNAINVKDCNSDALLAALEEIKNNTASAASSLATAVTSLSEILTEVQAINANTDQIESQLTTLITETVAGNTTLTEIKNTLVNEILPQIQAINANTDTVETLITETNTLLETLINNSDQVESLLSDIKDSINNLSTAFTAPCPGAINVNVCNNPDPNIFGQLLEAQQATNDLLATLITNQASTNDLLTQLNTTNTNTNEILTSQQDILLAMKECMCVPPEAPAMVTTKTLLGLSNPSNTQVGDVIKYEVKVENTGDVDLINVTPSDPNGVAADPVSAPGSPVPQTIAPGASFTWVYTHTITAADIAAGVVNNEASATGTSPGGASVTDLSGNVAVPIVVNGLEVVKTIGTYVADPNNAQPGDVITYNITVKNTGNTTLTNVTISEPAGFTVIGSPIASLAPNAVNTTNFTVTHTVTAAEVAAGVVNNQATGTGTGVDPLTGAPLPVTALSSPSVGAPPGPTVQPLAGAVAQLNVIKSQTGFSGTLSAAKVGDVITYEIVTTNTGTVPVIGISVTDVNAVITSGASIPSLNPGQSATSIATHVLTMADIVAGVVNNTASASGSSSMGTVSDASPAIATLFTPASPAFKIIKTVVNVTRAGVPVVSPYRVGDVINYNLAVQNTGNIPLTNITITDPNATVTGSPIASLAIGATTNITATHVITAADITADVVNNQASGIASSVNGPASAASQPSATSPPGQTVTPTPGVPGIDLVKTRTSITRGSAVIPATPTPTLQVGDVITYSAVITNTGNEPLTSVTLTDPGSTIVGGGAIGALAVGASVTKTITHTLTAADIAANTFTNAASVTGSSASGPVSDTSTVTTVYCHIEIANGFTAVNPNTTTSTQGVTVTTTGGIQHMQSPMTHEGATASAFTGIAPGAGAFNMLTPATGGGTMTITLPAGAINPVIHVDRLGGTSTTVVGSTSTHTPNGTAFTLTTPGATLTELSGTTHMQTTATTFRKELGTPWVGAGAAGSTQTGATVQAANQAGQAGGSLQVNGLTGNTISFNWAHEGPSGQDGFRISISYKDC